MALTNTPVIVGVDGSPDSHAAVELGAWEANRRGLPLRLAQAHAPLDNTAAPLTDRYPRLSVTPESGCW